MRLSELKKMVKEEYTRYLKEQAGPPVPPPMAGPGGAPNVTVEPGDIDVLGGEDAEATLRDIYEMLKDFFEGGGAGAPAGPTPGGAADADFDGDDDDDADDADDADDDADDDKVDEDKEDDEDDKDDKKENKKELKERFQKLANIIK